MPGLKTAQVFMNVVVLHFPPVFSELLYNSLLNRITEYNNKACICLAKQSIFQADQLSLIQSLLGSLIPVEPQTDYFATWVISIPAVILPENGL